MDISKRAEMCVLMCAALYERVAEREEIRAEKGFVPYSIDKDLTKTSIERMITQLRADLLKLKNEIGSE